MQVGVRSRSRWPLRTRCVDAMRCLPCRIVPGGPTGVADRRRRRGARHPFVGRLRAAPPAVRTACRREASDGGCVVNVAVGARGPRMCTARVRGQARREEHVRRGRPAHRVRGLAAVRPTVGLGTFAGDDLVGPVRGERVALVVLLVVVPVHGAEHVPELAQDVRGGGRGRRGVGLHRCTCPRDCRSPRGRGRRGSR